MRYRLQLKNTKDHFSYNLKPINCFYTKNVKFRPKKKPST